MTIIVNFLGAMIGIRIFIKIELCTIDILSYPMKGKKTSWGNRLPYQCWKSLHPI
jgi:hypothetical protein